MIPEMLLSKKFRKLKGNRSYADLARAVGCTPQNVRKILDFGTEPRFVLGVKLARTLGADIDWLVDDEAEGPPPVDQKDRVAAMVEQLLTSGGLVGELTAEEIELLGAFRKLTEIEKVRLSGFLAGLLSREPLTPQGAAAEIQAAADRAPARRQADRRSTETNRRPQRGDQSQ